MTEHTKGLWEVDHNLGLSHGASRAIVSTNGDDLIIIADVQKTDDKINNFLKDEQGMANAHLIAAAPDMLEALKEIIPDMEHYVATHGPGPDRRLARAIAAIKKAKGE